MSIDVASAAHTSTLGRLQRFPVSIILTLQLAVTVAVPALIKETEPIETILGICAVAVAAAFCIELISSPLRVRHTSPKIASLAAARWLLIVGLVAIAVTTIGGQGSYAVQLGLAELSPLVSIFTPFDIWATFGAVLYMWFYRENLISKRRAWTAVGAVITAHAAAGLYRGIVGQAAAAIIALLIIALLMCLVRLRVLAVLIAALVLIWPTIYDFRDSLRHEVSGASVVSSDDAVGRLQLDEQMSLVGYFGPGSDQVAVPSASTVIRTGVLPSVIDSDRPPLNTGAMMSVATGGSPMNSRSATFFGNVYIFEGLVAVGVVAAAIAVIMGMAMRRSRSPWAFMVAGIIYQYLMSFNASYPNGIAALLQGCGALIVAYIFVHFLRVKQAKPRSGDRAVLRPTQMVSG